MGQQREKIKKLTFEFRDSTYYNQQSNVWKSYVKEHKKDEEAWYNYFLATRYAYRNSPFEVGKKIMDELFTEMEKSIPRTFTFYLTKGWQLGVWDVKSFEYLEKAIEINPLNSEVLNEFIVRSEVYGTREKRKEFNQRYFDAQYDSPELLNISYNILSSLEPNAILFTGGDNDTFPLWVLQDVKGFRSDVLVLNSQLIGIDAYRERVLKEGNVILPKAVADSLTLGEGSSWDKQKAQKLNQKLVQTLAKYSNRPIYIAHSISDDDDLRKNIKDKSYVVGLASLYSETRVDNVALIKKHYENDYLLDYLLIHFRKDEKVGVMKYYNQIYIGPFVTLYKHYVLSGEEAKAKRLKIYLDVIAKEANKEGYVQSLLK